VGYVFDADFGKEGFSECLALEGKLLVEMTTHMIAAAPPEATPGLSPSDVLPEGEPYDVLFTVYLTRAKKLIITLDETGGNDTPTYYAVYDSLRSLREDPQVTRLPPLERAGLLRSAAKEARRGLGDHHRLTGVYVQQNPVRESSSRTRHICRGCSQHRSVFSFRGQVRADLEHDFCPRCYRSMRDRLPGSDLL
jgi:hypothetical protein